MTEYFEESEHTEKNNTGRFVCNYLRNIRKGIAESNGIEFDPGDCHNTEPCTGTCPVCDAECKYLEEQLKKKMESGEKIIIEQGDFTSKEFTKDSNALSRYMEESRVSLRNLFGPSMRMGAALRSKEPYKSPQKTGSNNPMSAILEEDPQTLALILASISPHQGVLILSALLPYKQYDVIRRIALLDGTDTEIMEKTKAVLGSKQLSSSKDDYAVIDGVDSVAGLLNIADLGTKNNVLERLKAKDPELAYEIRLKTISFGDLLILDDDAVKRVLNDQDDDVIAFALKGARDEEQSLIFNNLSEERAKAIGKQMAIMGAVHMRDVEKAEQKIADTIIKRGYNAEIASIWMQRQPDIKDESESMTEGLKKALKQVIEDLAKEIGDVYTEKDHPGRDVCDYLRWIRRQIADQNGIEFEPAECHNTKPCTGTCPVCESENRYLEDQLRKKAERGEDVNFVCGRYTTEELLNTEGVMSDLMEAKRRSFPDMFRLKPKELKRYGLLGHSAINERYELSGNTIDPQMVNYLKEEQSETIARILFQLDPCQAAVVLSIYTLDKQTDLIRRVCFIKGDDLDDLNESLEADFLSTPRPEGLDKAVSILNNVDKDREGGILAELEKGYPELEAEIRRMMLDS